MKFNNGWDNPVCSALDLTYNENLKNPSAHTIRLWTKEGLISKAEDEIERHIKGQLTMFFLGHQRRVKILSQTNTNAGRADLIFLQNFSPVAPSMMGVLELKVLRGPEKQGYIRDSQQTTRCFRTRNAVVTVPARPNVSVENSGDFCTSAST